MLNWVEYRKCYTTSEPSMWSTKAWAQYFLYTNSFGWWEWIQFLLWNILRAMGATFNGTNKGCKRSPHLINEKSERSENIKNAVMRVLIYFKCKEKKQDHPVALPRGTRVIIRTKDTDAQYGHGGHLGKQTVTIWIHFLSRNPRRLKMKNEQNWPRGFTGDVIWIGALETKV